jgi:hypothetical protein
MHNVSDVRQIEVHTAEPAEIVFANLKTYKSPGSNQILAELIQAGGETLMSVFHKLIHSISSMEELPDQWKESC